LIIACGVAIAAGTIASIKLRHRWLTGEAGAADFTWWWRAGHALLAGDSLYRAIDATGPYPFREGFLYPLLAAVVGAPFALVDLPTGFVLFVAVSTAILSLALTRDGY
jgi:hypothetical protein